MLNRLTFRRKYGLEEVLRTRFCVSVPLWLICL